MPRLVLAAVLALTWSVSSLADVGNLKIVTDASPDYTDLPSLVHSATSSFATPAEKCWAMFYWNHIARRQTMPMSLHGMAHTDPIRQFNDYGFTMCSTISGVNQSIWEHMGLRHRYWDISNHTVCEVFYDGRWHMYDSSLSAIYTLCDGKTIAGVEDIGKEGACAASGGKVEGGHIARYHCLTATSPRGFLTGADCARDLDQEYACFSPKGLKLRTYFYDWDYGHRYILNLRANESYTRHYASQGDGPEFFVPNHGKDPELASKYRLRGNGAWVFRPSLAAADWQKAAHSASQVAAGAGGLQPEKPGQPGVVVYKVQGANVITGQVIEAELMLKGKSNTASVAVSTNNGRSWKELFKSADDGEIKLNLKAREEVNGAYEVLVRFELNAAANPGDAVLRQVSVQTTTQLNTKTQPRLNVGKNTVYVGAGEPTDSIVFWPELQDGKYKEHVVEEKNIACDQKHVGYQGVLYPSVPKEDAYVVYRLDAPRDISKFTFGGRFYNRHPGSRIEMHWSTDGKNWTKAWTLTSVEQPWDVIRYETIAVPAGNRAVWAKYVMNSPVAERTGCSLYAVRMEANHAPADPAFRPFLVTFNWAERQADRSLVKRSHTQVVNKLPATYTVNVGGADHPVMEALTIADPPANREIPAGYSDGKDAGGEKWVGTWLTTGKNLAVGKSYTLSLPSATNWGAGDPDGKKLTDGIAGPPYAGGTSYKFGALWDAKKNPVITLDLGAPTKCAAFGLNVHGYPGWDALKGAVKDRIEVLVSPDGQTWTPAGFLQTDLRWKDLPVNHMWPDHETIEGHTFRLIPPQPVETRYVQYKVTNARFFCVTEIEVLDAIQAAPFDLRVALPR